MATKQTSAAENGGQTSIEDMERQIAELTRKVEEAKAMERNQVIAEIKKTMAKHGLTVADLESSARRGSTGVKIPPKYRNPETGETWTGRGRAPTWLAGRDKEEFLIK